MSIGLLWFQVQAAFNQAEGGFIMVLPCLFVGRLEIGAGRFVIASAVWFC